MSTIVTRAGKGSPLTNTELDSNFQNLNTDKAELSGATFTGNLKLSDGTEFQLGDSSEFKIKHHASGYTHLENTVGTLFIDSDSVTFRDDDGSPTNVLINQSGIDVTGSVVADGLTVDGNSVFTTADNTAQVTLISTDTDALVGPKLNLWRNSGTGTNGDLIGEITFTGEDTVGSTNIFASISSIAEQTNNGAEDGSLHFNTLLNGTLAKRLSIGSASTGGDISFYDSSGSSQNLYWDSSASRLGLGTTNPNAPLSFGVTSVNSQVALIRDNSTSRTGFGITNDYGVRVFGPSDASATGNVFEVGQMLASNGTTYQNTRFAVQYNGNVNIGSSLMVGATTAPTMPLSVKAASNAYAINMHGRSDGYSEIYGSSSDGSTRYAFLQTHSAQTKLYTLVNTPLLFGTNSTERMRLSGGNLLVGKTTTNFGTQGIALNSNGSLDITKSGDAGLFLNRLSSDGNIIDLRKDGTSVGSIGASGGDLVIGSKASGHKGVRFGSSYIAPINTSNAFEDNTTDLGLPAVRFKDLHLSGTANSYRAHIKTASSGASADVSADELVVESNGNAGISILSGQSNSGSIYFGDAGVNYDGYIAYSQPTRSMTFGTAAGSRMTIDSSGRVGIGSSPSAEVPLTAVYSSTSQFHFGGAQSGISNNTYYNGSAWANRNASVGGSIFQMSTSGEFNWRRAGTGANPTLNYSMTLTSDGNLLVGKTATTFSVQGTVLNANGTIDSTRSGDAPLYLNRLANDGSIIALYKDTVSVGAVSTWGGELAVGRLNCALLFDDDNNHITPHSVNSDLNRDAAIDLGDTTSRFKDLYLSGTANVQYAGATDTGIYFNGSFNAVVPYRPDTGVAVDDYLDLGVYSHRWDDIFATNGTIQTSDRNEKQDIESLTEAEERVAIAAKSLLKKFRWKSAVEDKGDDARIHFGIIAQDLQAAFEAEGLDAGRYGMFTSNTWTNEDGEEQTRMGVRYSELLAFIISAI